MGFILLDPPMEVYRKAAAMEAWIAELDRLAEEYADDDEILAQLRQERADSEVYLARLQTLGDAEGEDDGIIDLDE